MQVEFSDQTLSYGDDRRILSHRIRKVYEHEGFYYVLLNNWSLRIYQVRDGRLKRIAKPKGLFGEKLLFHQNILYGMADAGYECGVMAFVAIRHCHELRHKYPKAQCKNIQEELFGCSLYDGIFVGNLPIVLVENGYYINDERSIFIVRTVRERDDGSSMVYITYGEWNHFRHGDTLFSYNGYVYAIGTDQKKYVDPQTRCDCKAPIDQHQLVCNVFLPIGNELININHTVSQPGILELVDPLNQMVFKGTRQYRGQWSQTYYEFQMNKHYPSPNVIRSEQLSDIVLLLQV